MGTQTPSQAQAQEPELEQLQRQHQWTLVQHEPRAETGDDEDALRCEACHTWMHAREQRPYYQLHIITAGGLFETFQRLQQSGEYLVCPTCAQQHVTGWLGATFPQFMVVDAGFRHAEGWRTINEEGGHVSMQLEVHP